MSPSSSLLLLAKTVTHPAARSLCDSWASCSSCLWLRLQSWLMPQSPHRLRNDLKRVEWDCHLFYVCVQTVVVAMVIVFVWDQTWLMPRHSHRSVGHRPLDYIQLCHVLPSLPFSSCTWSRLSTFLALDPFPGVQVTLFLCGIAVSAVGPAWRCCHHFSMRNQTSSVFTALHGMQTRYSDENSVRLSVRHTRELWQNGIKICPDFYTLRKTI